MQLILSFLSGTLFFSLYHYFQFSIPAIFISVAVLLALKRKTLLLLFVVIGIFYAFLRYSPADDMPYPWGKELRVTGRFTQENIQAAGRDIRTFVVDTAHDDETGEEEEGLRDKKIGLTTDLAVDYDDRYELLVETGKDKTRLNPGQLWKGRLFGKVIAVEDAAEAPVSLFAVFDKHRGSLNRYISGRFEEDSAAFISTITTGRAAQLNDELRDAFNATGLAHILSISGTHFGMFSLMLFGLFIFLIKRLPYQYLQRLTIYLSPQQAAALLSIPFMVMYLGISGGSVPAVRSFVMINLFLFGLLLGRQGFWLNSLLFAAVVLVLWDPDVITGLSFQLSFVAVLFIGFSIEKKDTVEEIQGPEDKKARAIRYIKNAVMLSVAASLGTSPLAAYYFHYVSLISPLSNLVVVPLVGFVLVPLSLISSFAYIFTGHYIFAPLVSASSELIVAIVKLLAEIPYAELRAPSFPPALCFFFYAGFLLYIVSGRNKKILALPFVPFCIYAVLSISEKKDLSVTFVDVGQADSAVIELPDRKTIVIDTGMTGKETAAFLRHQGKRVVDALILTHNHPDHAGGMEHIMKRFNVREVWDNGSIVYPQGLANKTRHRTLERGDVIEADAYKITVLHPYREFYSLRDDAHSEENNSSLVLKISGKKKSFLFTGDIEEEAEENILHLGKWLPADVIKVPHHGSRTSTSDDFLSEVSPAIAVISVGRNNSFGHPSQEVLRKLEGKSIFRTDRDGAIKIIEKGDDLVVKTCREFMFKKADDFRTEKENIKKLFSVW